MASVKNLSLGKNEDPKRRGSGGAKQVSLDGTTVPPSLGRLKIEEPKIENVRWYGETAVTPAAISKLPTLEMPSVAGVIENATPKDAGRYAESLTAFSQQVAQGGKSAILIQEANRKENDARANEILTQFSDNTSPIKDLTSLLSGIDKKIKQLEKIEIGPDNQPKPKSQEVLQQIIDLKKHKEEIASKRGLQNSINSKLREEQVVNNALSWDIKKHSIEVEDTNVNGGITSDEGELKTIKVSELDPNDFRYRREFKKHVYADYNLTGFELNNVKDRIAGIKYNDIVSQTSDYQKLTKNNITTKVLTSLEKDLDHLVNGNKNQTSANVIQSLNENLEFYKNSHLYSEEEKNALVTSIVGLTMTKLSKSDIDVEDFLNDMFFGDLKNNIQPLMVGPIDDRYKKKGDINEKLFLINRLGGKPYFQALLTTVKADQADTKSKKIKGQSYIYENHFDKEVMQSEVTVDGKKMSLNKALILSDTDDKFGNTYVQVALTKLEDAKESLIALLDENDPDYIVKLNTINEAYTERKNKSIYKILTTDYNQEVKELRRSIFNVQMNPNDLKAQSKLTLSLEQFTQSYEGIPKADEEIADIRENLVKVKTKTFTGKLKENIKLVETYWEDYAKTQTKAVDFDKDIEWSTNELSITQTVSEIMDDAREAYPNDLNAQDQYVKKEIGDRWRNGGFINKFTSGEQRVTDLTGKVNVAFKGIRTGKEVNNKLNKITFVKNKTIDGDGYLVGAFQMDFKRNINRPQPYFEKNALKEIMISWMKGEKLPRGIELFIKNLTNTNTPDMASFILSQADKLGIKQSKLKIEYINSITDMNEEQRKAAWEESGY